MTGQGGWPLNVFFDPEGVPFFGGTYFPPEPRAAACRASARSWRRCPRPGEHAPDEIRAAAPRTLRGSCGRRTPAAHRQEILSPAVLDEAERALAAQFDHNFGGFGGAPKFPPSSALEFLLARVGDGKATGDRPREMVDVTLERMASGRHLRPGRRRLRPLLGRRALAGAALREDALRQRAAGPLLPARVAADRRRRCSAASARRPSTGRCARCAAPRAASTRRSTPTPRARRASSTSGRADELRDVLGDDADALLRALGRRPRAQLRGPQHPVRAPATRRSTREVARARPPDASTKCARSASGRVSTTSA